MGGKLMSERSERISRPLIGTKEARQGLDFSLLCHVICRCGYF